MKYTSKKGSVITIPNGLSAKQIAKIKADADAGYGTRAQATADRLKGATKAAPVADERVYTGLGKEGYGQGLHGNHAYNGQAPAGSVVVPPLNPAVNKKTGVVNADKANAALDAQTKKDVEEQWKLDQPAKITDQYGNVRIVSRNPQTGEVTITDELGGTAQTFKDLATAAAQTFNGDVSRQKAEEATYGTLTKYYDRDQDRELEAAKQEMADRGIPYDPAAAQDMNSSNLYGRTIGGIGEKYRGLKDTASQQAVLAGNQAYATDAAARDSFLSAATQGASTFSGGWTPYSNTIDTTVASRHADILKLSAEAYMAKYGIDQDTYIKDKAIAASGKSSGGGGGGGGSGGFEIVS